MSASKLEKKIWTLETRLRQEFQQELQDVISRMDYLEAQLCMQREAENLNVSVENPKDLTGVLPELPNEVPEAVEPAARKSRVSRFNPNAVVPEDAGEALGGGRPQRWVPLEPVAFLESTWNVVLVLGYTESGWLDVIIACLMLLISAGLQITFSIILLSKDFLGDPFTSEIDAAQSWRRKVAHDYKHMDLAQTSLVSRVCNQADGLIVSNDQASLIGQINSFLGLDNEEFEPDGLRPGILLCMLCILLWCLYLCNEFRMIFVSLEAVSQVPRGWRTKVEDGRFIVMSYMRFTMYCLMRFARAVIAGLLLYAGIVWLANTTSISDLMLNAVALGAVLDVDEMFFAALMPKKIQIKIQDLEAIKITYSKRRSEVESVLLVLGMLALMFWPWYFLVEPLGEQMKEVKLAYCGGYQDFVVAVNENLGVPIAFRTTSFSEASVNQSLIEFSVDEFLQQADTSTSEHLRIAFSSGDFETKRTETVLATATNHLLCQDLDGWYLNGVHHEYKESLAPFWWSTAVNLGLSTSSTCANMSGYCESSDGQLLRLVCPITCGCASAQSNPWYKVTGHGCPTKCDTDRSSAVSASQCVDADTVIDWASFWDAYPSIMSDYLTLESAETDANVTALQSFMKANASCAGLADAGSEPLTSGSWCEGNSGLWSPLAYLCPVTCGCSSESSVTEKPDYCPSACTCQDLDEVLAKIADNIQIPSGYGYSESLTDCASAVRLNVCKDPVVERFCSKSCGVCTTE